MTISLSMFIILLTASGQILLKKGALHGKRLFLNKYVILGYCTFVAVAFLSITLMNYLPLKYFSIIVSFSYPVTILFATILLKEKISLKTLIACIIIVLGGIVFNF